MNARKAKSVRRAIGYIRVTTVDKADHGASLETQERAIWDWCNTNGYAHRETKVDLGLIVGLPDRPALQEALSEVQGGEALVVYSLSVLARSTRDTLAIVDALDRKGADLVSLREKIDTTSAECKMLFRVLLVLAEFEREMISERTSMAMKHLRATGKFTGGRAPFGFALLPNGDLEPVPDEQAVIARVHSLRAEGASLRKIAEVLHQEGHRSRMNRFYVPEQIRRMVRLACQVEAPMAISGWPRSAETTGGADP